MKKLEKVELKAVVGGASTVEWINQIVLRAFLVSQGEMSGEELGAFIQEARSAGVGDPDIENALTL